MSITKTLLQNKVEQTIPSDHTWWNPHLFNPLLEIIVKIVLSLANRTLKPIQIRLVGTTAQESKG